MAIRNISVTLGKKLLSKLDELAEESERNRSWLINKAVENYLEELEDLKLAKNRLTEPRISPTIFTKF